MSQLIGLKEKGLPQIARLLQSGNSDVVRSGASLLSNMSRHPVLHRVMGKMPVHSSFHVGHTGLYFLEPSRRLSSNYSIV